MIHPNRKRIGRIKIVCVDSPNALTREIREAFVRHPGEYISSVHVRCLLHSAVFQSEDPFQPPESSVPGADQSHVPQNSPSQTAQNHAHSLSGFPMQKCAAEFDDITTRFIELIKRRLKGPRGGKPQFLVSQDAAQCIVESGSEIKRMCRLNAEWHRLKTSTGVLSSRVERWNPIRKLTKYTGSESHSTEPDPEAMDERFYRSIVGQCTKDGATSEASVKLFLILIWHRPRIDSQHWMNFVDDQISQDKRLCDRLFPFHDPAEVEEAFGCEGNLNFSIFWKQNMFNPPHIISGHNTIKFFGEPVLPLEEIEEINIDHSTPSRLYIAKIAPTNFTVQTCDHRLVKKDVHRKRSREVDVWSHLSKSMRTCGHITEIFASISFDDQISIFMPIAKGNLHEFLTEQLLTKPFGPCESASMFRNGVEVSDKARLFRKILGPLDALKFLHTGLRNDKSDQIMFVAHLDIKLQNILVFIDSDGEIVLKITDFEMAGIKARQDQESGQQRQVTFANRWQSQGGNCTPPEIIESSDQQPTVTFSFDVWGYACVCVMYVVWLCGGPLSYEKFARVREHDLKPWIDCSSDEFWQICSRESPKDIKNLHVDLITENDCNSVPVTLKFNPTIVEFLEDLFKRCTNDRERMMYESAVAVLLKGAFPTNPEARLSAAELLDQLTDVVRKCENPQSSETNMCQIDKLGSFADRLQSFAESIWR